MATKTHNEYVFLLEKLYDETPKAVLAAILVSKLILLSGNENTEPAYLQAALLDEWRNLHAARIVPQKPLR